MYIYNFDIINKKIIQYNSESSGAMIVELYDPLLSFLNNNFSEYNLLRQKILQFIQEFESSFDEMEPDEIIAQISKSFPDFQFDGIDNGEIWWIAELILYLLLHSPYIPFFYMYKLTRDEIQNENELDFLYWQKKTHDKVQKVFDVDKKGFIENFSPMCRLHYYFGESLLFNEAVIVHPSDYEKFTKSYNFFAYPFDPTSESATLEEEYRKYESQRQKYIRDNLHVISGYRFHSLEEAYSCEIFKMAQLGIVLRQCKNCGKYFIFNPKQPAEYCSKKLPDVNMTCQQVAAQRKYKENLSPIQKLYTNALKNRNKWYPSKKSGLRTPEQTQQYEKWKKRTSEIRNIFQERYNNAHTDMQKEKILEDFKQTLKE